MTIKKKKPVFDYKKKKAIEIEIRKRAFDRVLKKEEPSKSHSCCEIGDKNG